MIVRGHLEFGDCGNCEGERISAEAQFASQGEAAQEATCTDQMIELEAK